LPGWSGDWLILDLMVLLDVRREMLAVCGEAVAVARLFGLCRLATWFMMVARILSAAVFDGCCDAVLSAAERFCSDGVWSYRPLAWSY